MEINKTKHKIDNKFYHKVVSDKEQILLGDSLRKDSNHLYRMLTNTVISNVKNWNNYTISRNGEVYEHFDSTYYSSFINNDTIDKKIVSIILENMGALYLDDEKKIHLNWIGEECLKSNVIEKQFKTIKFWEKYTEEQYQSLAELIIILSDKHNIDLKVNCDNSIYDDDAKTYGYATKGNYLKDSNELNPTFDFNKLENILNNLK